MKLIGFQDLKKLNLPPNLYYQWASEIINLKKECVLPPKISLNQAEKSFFNIMPSIIPEIDRMGIKVITRYPNRLPALSAEILLYRQSTGELLAIMDGTFITSMRTGAVAAHSIMLFSRRGFDSVGFIGLGNNAITTLEILLSSTDRKLNINLLKYKNQTKYFMKRFADYNLNFILYDRPEALIENSDCVVSSVTYAENDFAGDSYYQPGCTVIPIHTKGFGNCDLFFDKVFADDKGHVEHFTYFNKFKYFAETSDVTASRAKGRTDESERILVYNIGIGIQDIYFAEKLVNLIECSSPFDFNQPIDKFWA